MGKKKEESIWLERGNSLYKADRFEEAIRCYDQALKLDPRNTGAWNNKGLSLSKLGRHEEAILSFKKAIELNPKYANAWYNLAISEDSLDREKEAYAAYSSFCRLIMGFDAEFTFDGKLRVWQTDRAIVEDEFQIHASKRMFELQAILFVANDTQNDSINTIPQPQKIDVIDQKNNRLQANKEHEDDRISTPGFQDANQWYAKGKALLEMGTYREALNCFDNALKLEPDYAYAWYKKALCEHQDDRREDAVRSLQQALKFADDEIQLVQEADQLLQQLETETGAFPGHKELITSQGIEQFHPMKNMPSNLLYKPGDIIGQKYTVHKILGMGGFGIVYLVSDTDDVYALKTFRDEYLADSETRKRFLKEASVWVELEHHPYLVRAYFVDEVSGRLFIAMDYIAPNDQGIYSLAGYFQRHPPGLEQSLRWAIQISYGMEYAYSKGIRAHRDLKPENILISQDGRALITDFGLASMLEASPTNPARLLVSRAGNVVQSGQTQVGVGFGTFTHMSPEQFSNAASCDERSDIYSFGIMLYQMAAGGQLPFLVPLPKDDSEDESMRVWLEMQRLHSESSVPRLDSLLNPLIQRCLEKAPDKRYQSFEQLRLDLEPLLKRQAGEVIIPPQLKELEALDWNAKSISLINLGRNEEALRCLEKALEIDPLAASFWNNKGSNLRILGRHEEAILCYDKALEIYPEYVNAWSGKGIVLDGLDRHEEALVCYDTAVELDPKNEKAWHNKGVFLAGRGRHEEAIRCLNQALDLVPLDKYALIAKGNSLRRLGRYEEAIRCDNQALEFDPLEVTAWNNKGLCIEGLCLHGLGRHEEAVYCFDQSLKINPKNAEIWNLKGMSLNSLNQQKDAIQCFEKALEIDRKFALAWFNKGACLYSLGKNAESLTCYDHAIELDPSYVDAWLRKGATLGFVGSHNEAIKCFDKALELDPQKAESWHIKGIALCSVGSYTESLYCIDKALKLDSQKAEFWLSKGITLGSADRYTEALYCIDKSLELDPKNAESWFSKGITLHKMGRPTDAILCHDHALGLDPHKVEALCDKACILLDLGQFAQTINCCNQALKFEPRTIEAWYNKALAEENLGLKQEAIHSYQQFLNFAPAQHVEFIQQARRRIRE
jgi:tetratricopeptide (TPR) repeat protein